MRLLAPFRLISFTLVAVCLIAAALAIAAGLRGRVAQASADRERYPAANSSLTTANVPVASAGNTYTWVGGTPVVTTDWTVATNWNPQRLTPANTDNLVFDGNPTTGTPSPTITNIPTETIATLTLTNGVTATFNAAAGSQLTIAGATGSDLSIPSGTSLTVASGNALIISLSSGSKAVVAGQITFQDGAQRLIAADASGVTFQSNSIFTTASGFSGNPFGAGTNGSVIFQSGSAAFFNAGSDPFGGSTHSVATFNLGSSQTFNASSAFSSDGRTYGNLTLDGNQAYAGSGSGVLTIFNTLWVKSGSSLTLSGSANADLNLLGDLTVDGTLSTNGQIVKFQGGSATQNITTAATFGVLSISKTGGTVKLGGAVTVNGALQFDGTLAAVDVLEFNQNTLNLNGTVGGTSSSASNGFKGDAIGATLNIGGTGALGTLTFVSGSQSLKSLTVNRTSSGTVTLGTNLTIGNASVGSLTLTNGTVDVGSNTLSLASFPTITRTNGYVIGNLQKTFASTGNFTFTVGTANGYSPVDANVTAGTGNSLTVKAVQGKQPNFYTSNALQRYWRISVSANITVDFTFHYLATDVVGTESNYKFFKFHPIGFFDQLSPTTVNTVNHFAILNGTTVSDISSNYAEWTLADPTLNVNTTADANDGACTPLGAGNGCTLREAINTANQYSDPNTINFNIPSNDSGCIAGVCTIVLNSALNDLSTPISLAGTDPTSLIVKRSTVPGTPNFRIFTIGSGVTASISGLTVTNGRSADGGPGEHGGGVLNNGTLTLTGVTVNGNRAGNGTGSALTGSGGSGGGIFNLGTLTIKRSTISNNQTGDAGASAAAGVGGGISNGGTLVIVDTTLSGNTTGAGPFGAGLGGAVRNTGTLTMINSTMTGNHSGQGGGLDICCAGSAVIINTTISGNASDGFAGGLEVAGGAVVVSSATITNNRSDYNDSSNTLNGGGVSQNNGTITLKNTIVAGNFRGSSGATRDDVNGAFDAASSFNVIGDGTNMSGITNGSNGNQIGTSGSPINAMIGALANYGGPTMTHALLPGSPAINAGSNTNLPADTFDLDGDSNTAEPLPVDQRGTGFNRVVNTIVDIGAFESRGFSISATSGTPQSATRLTNFTSPLVATVTSAFSEPVTGGVVTFTAPDPNGGASATFPGSASAATATINGSGAATSPTLTANTTPGSYNVVASIGSGLPTASFALSNKAQTSTEVTSSLNPSVEGQNVTFTAKVIDAAGPPTGTVQFKDNGVNLGVLQTLQGVSFFSLATISTSSLTPGTHTITAEYSGDSFFSQSSGTLSGGQVVNQTGISIGDVSTSEGDSGPKALSFEVHLTGSSTLPITVNYATADNTATAPSDYVAQSGTLTFNPGEAIKTINVIINGDQKSEPDETLFVNLSNATNAVIIRAQATGTIFNDDPPGGFIRFSQTNYIANESSGFVTITVNRIGDTSAPVSVDYFTPDDSERASVPPCSQPEGILRPRCDFTTALGTLQFAPGETSKTFTVLISQDSFVEHTETLQLTLSNPTGGAVLDVNFTAGLTINDDSPEPSTNPIDDPEDFVRQHYHDFLNREPDAAGLDFWKRQITDCGADAQCIDVKRVNVSGAFYLSIEFQGTGYLVERMYKAAYGDVNGVSSFGGAHQIQVPVVRFNEFLRDTQKIGQGVIVGAPGWENQLEANKNSFAAEFVQRSRFSSAYSSGLSPTDFVNQLCLKTGTTPTPAERQSAIDEFGGALDTTNLAARGRALRKVAENPAFNQAEFNRAFVLMQYFGYLRRNPNAEASADYTGYDFWLTKLNQFGGNFQNAEMVKAFITSDEYRHRFGP